MEQENYQTGHIRLPKHAGAGAVSSSSLAKSSDFVGMRFDSGQHEMLIPFCTNGVFVFIPFQLELGIRSTPVSFHSCRNEMSTSFLLNGKLSTFLTE